MLKTESQILQPVTSVKDGPRIALIGCGAIAESFYLPAFVRHPSVLEKLILIDHNQARARKLAAEFNAKDSLADYHEVLNEEIEGAIIATPSHLHCPIAMECLSRGVHLLCEKPLAESARDAREMVDMARKTGATILTNNTRRLYASSRKVKELLSEKTLGEPLSIQYYEGAEFSWPTVSGFYFNTKVSSKGVLLDKGAHVLDLLCWWLGDKPKVLSSQNDSFGGREAVAHVQFAHKECVGEVKLSFLSHFPCVYRLTCEAGTIEGDVDDFRGVVLTTNSGQKERLKLKCEQTTYDDFAYTLVTNFLDVIRKGETPLVSGADVLASIEFIDECYKAASRFKMPWYEVAEVSNG